MVPMGHKPLRLHLPPRSSFPESHKEASEPPIITSCLSIKTCSHNLLCVRVFCLTRLRHKWVTLSSENISPKPAWMGQGFSIMLKTWFGIPIAYMRASDFATWLPLQMPHRTNMHPDRQVMTQVVELLDVVFDLVQLCGL